MNKKEFKKLLKKIWYFIWEDDSIWSWIVNIILAFVLIKFVVYPGLGFVLSTSHPVVAVVSESMEHNDMEFDKWWEKNKDWYVENGINKEYFEKFSLKNGFNKGDIMVLRGRDAESIEIGEVIVFRSGRKDPIIHRVVKKIQNDDKIYFQTKGDNNKDSIKSSQLDETNIGEDIVIGKVILRVPLLGYIKIWFVEILKFIGLA
jgi:hypothetical protein